MYETILFESVEGVATITLNRPESLNSINKEMVHDLSEAFRRCRNDPAVRCLVLTGAGRGFCAGADLGADFVKNADDIAGTLRERYNPIIKGIGEMEKPVIAAVNGVAAGAGCNMALACDLVIAAESATFVQAFVKVGLVPDAGGSYFLPRLVGAKKAMEMALLGEKITAAAAAGMGLVNFVVKDDQFASEVRKLALRLASGPYCQGLIKVMFNRSLSMNLDQCLDMEAECQAGAAASEDFAEGVRAFLEKRQAIFKGK